MTDSFCTMEEVVVFQLLPAWDVSLLKDSNGFSIEIGIDLAVAELALAVLLQCE